MEKVMVMMMMMALVIFWVSLNRHRLLVDDSGSEFGIGDRMAQTFVYGDRPIARRKVVAAADARGRAEEARVGTSN